ncbi:MAG: hypothetical protein WAV46_00365, partial [Candidatus Moraniibacteriota bacterium]
IVAMAIFYIVSTGDEGMMSTAKSGIKAAMIGFAVMLSAWLIVNIVLTLLVNTQFLSGIKQNGVFTFSCDVTSSASSAPLTRAGNGGVAQASLALDPVNPAATSVSVAVGGTAQVKTSTSANVNPTVSNPIVTTVTGGPSSLAPQKSPVAFFGIETAFAGIGLNISPTTITSMDQLSRGITISASKDTPAGAYVVSLRQGDTILGTVDVTVTTAASLGTWERHAEAYGFSPPPPTCAAQVSEGGACEVGSLCTREAGYFTCIPGSTADSLSIVPSSGTFNLSQTSPATLVFTLSGATQGDLEACYEVVAHSKAGVSLTPGACDNSANFAPFDGNAEWRWNGSALIGTFPYRADMWGAEGIQTKSVFRKASDHTKQASAIITTSTDISQSSSQTNIIIDGARWGSMNLVISGTYPTVETLVQKIRTWPNVADYATCISINGDVIYGTAASADPRHRCGSVFDLMSPNYKSASFTPITHAPLLGQPLDSGAGKLIVEPITSSGYHDFVMEYQKPRSFQFTTGDVGEIGRFEFAEASPSIAVTVPANTNLNLVPEFGNISTVPNDFRYDNLDGATGFDPQCTTYAYRVVNPTDPPVAGCRLRPHATYYLNIRNENAENTKRGGSARGKDSGIGYPGNAGAFVINYRTYQGSPLPANPSAGYCEGVIGGFCLNNSTIASGTNYAKNDSAAVGLTPSGTITVTACTLPADGSGSCLGSFQWSAKNAAHPVLYMQSTQTVDFPLDCAQNTLCQSQYAAGTYTYKIKDGSNILKSVSFTIGKAGF